METVKCPSCGGVTPASLPLCQYCGAQLWENCPDTEEFNEVKSRNGFVTFWLWLGIIVNVLMGLAYLFTCFTSKGMSSAHEPMWSRIFGVASAAVMVYGYISLLKWRMSGFTIIVCMQIISALIGVFNGSNLLLAILSVLFSLGILYGVLHIRKNGVSCWNNLD